MERVRPGVVVTICLPLLMIDDPDAKKLVTDNPVITIDGCPKCCSQKNLEAQVVKADRTFQAIKFYTAHKELKPDGIAELDENGRKLAAIAADELAPIELVSFECEAEGEVEKFIDKTSWFWKVTLFPRLVVKNKPSEVVIQPTIIVENGETGPKG